MASAAGLVGRSPPIGTVKLTIGDQVETPPVCTPHRAAKNTATGDFVASIFDGKSVGSVIGVDEAAAKIWQAVTPRGLALRETPLAESR